MPLFNVIVGAFVAILLLALLARVVRASAIATLIVNTAAAFALFMMVVALYAAGFGR